MHSLKCINAYLRQNSSDLVDKAIGESQVWKAGACSNSSGAIDVISFLFFHVNVIYKFCV